MIVILLLKVLGACVQIGHGSIFSLCQSKVGAKFTANWQISYIYSMTLSANWRQICPPSHSFKAFLEVTVDPY